MQPNTNIKTEPKPASDARETRRLIDAIARDLSSRYGQSGEMNWDGVDRHLSHIVQHARRELRNAQPRDHDIVLPPILVRRAR